MRFAAPLSRSWYCGVMSASFEIASFGVISGSIRLKSWTVKSSGKSRKWQWYSEAVCT